VLYSISINSFSTIVLFNLNFNDFEKYILTGVPPPAETVWDLTSSSSLLKSKKLKLLGEYERGVSSPFLTFLNVNILDWVLETTSLYS